jgi:hypothetical protein
LKRVTATLLAGALALAACGDATGDVITREPGACDDVGGCTHPERPICDTAGGTCVECLSDGHCNAIGERCSTVLRECAVPCTSSDQCPPDDAICDGAIGFCVECRDDGDCGIHEPFCRNSECVIAD